MRKLRNDVSGVSRMKGGFRRKLFGGTISLVAGLAVVAGVLPPSPAWAAALTNITVTPTNTTDGATTTYTVLFEATTGFTTGTAADFVLDATADATNTTTFSSTGTYTVTDCGAWPGTCGTPSWQDTTPTVTVSNSGPTSGKTVSLVDSAANTVTANDAIQITATGVVNPTTQASYYLAVSTGAPDGPTNSPNYSITSGVATQLRFCAVDGGPVCPGSFSGTAGSGISMIVYPDDVNNNQTCIFPAGDGGTGTDCTAGSVTVCLATSSAAGAFSGAGVTTGASVATTCTIAPPASESWTAYLTIATGSTEGLFTYTDTVAGSPTITAADEAAALTKVNLAITVNAAPASQVVLGCVSGCSATPSSTANLELKATVEDPYGNIETSGGPWTVTWSDASSGGEFSGYSGSSCTGTAPTSITTGTNPVYACYGNPVQSSSPYPLTVTTSPSLTCNTTSGGPACPLNVTIINSGAVASDVIISGPTSAAAQCAKAYSDGCKGSIYPTIGPFTVTVTDSSGNPFAWTGSITVKTNSTGSVAFAPYDTGTSKCDNTSTGTTLTLSFTSTASQKFCYADTLASEYLQGGVTDLSIGTVTPGSGQPTIVAGTCPPSGSFTACGTQALTITPEPVGVPDSNGLGGGDVAFLAGVCPQPYAPPIVTGQISGSAGPLPSIPVCMELTDQFGNFGAPAVAPTGGVNESVFTYPGTSGNEFSMTRYGAPTTEITIPAGDNYVTFYYGNSNAGFDPIAAYGNSAQLGTTGGGVNCGSTCGVFGPGGLDANISAGTAVSNATASVSPAVTGQTATYTITFKTSSTGSLTGGSSIIQLNAATGAPGTQFPIAASDYTVAVTGTSTSGTATATPTLSNSGAAVSFVVPTSVTVAASTEVTVTVTSVLNPSSTSSSDYLDVSTSADSALVATNQYTIGNGSSQSMTIVKGTNQSTGLGQAFGTPLEVELTNGSGAPVAGTVVTFTAPSAGASGTFQASGSNVEIETSNSQGIAQTSLLFANQVNGSFSVSAAASGFPTQTFVLSNGAGSGISTLDSAAVADPSSVDANGISFSVVTVTLENGLGVPAQGKTVVLTSSSSTAVVSPSTAVTDISGKATFHVSDATQETVIFTATDTTDQETVDEQAIVDFSSAPAMTISPSSLTFGATAVGSHSQSQAITFTNDGSEALQVTGLSQVGYDPTDFTVTQNNCTATLSPGSSCTVGIVFKPQGTCTRSAEYKILDTAVDSPQVINVSGTGATSSGSVPADCASVPTSGGTGGTTPLITSHGYWLVASDGGVFAYGGAHYYGSTGGMKLDAPVVGMASTPDGHGYWLVASDGGIFTFGDASFYGSTGGMKLDAPVVGMASTPDGHGYWLVASDGGIFTFGDASFRGSTGNLHLAQPVVGMASTPDGHGYWLVASDGGVFTFGDARYYGSASGYSGGQPVKSIASTLDGAGYWLVGQGGSVYPFGDAAYLGSAPAGSTAIVTAPGSSWGQIGDAVGGAYWTAGPGGAVVAFGDASFGGDYSGPPLVRPVVGMAAAG